MNDVLVIQPRLYESGEKPRAQLVLRAGETATFSACLRGKDGNFTIYVREVGLTPWGVDWLKRLNLFTVSAALAQR